MDLCRREKKIYKCHGPVKGHPISTKVRRTVGKRPGIKEMPKYQPTNSHCRRCLLRVCLYSVLRCLIKSHVSCNSCFILCIIVVILHLNFCTPLLHLIEVTVQYIFFASVQWLIGFTGNHILCVPVLTLVGVTKCYISCELVQYLIGFTVHYNSCAPVHRLIGVTVRYISCELVHYLIGFTVHYNSCSPIHRLIGVTVRFISCVPVHCLIGFNLYYYACASRTCFAALQKDYIGPAVHNTMRRGRQDLMHAQDLSGYIIILCK